MSEERELFADIIVGIMTGDTDFVGDKLVFLDSAELDHLFQGSKWFQKVCKDEVEERKEFDKAWRLRSTSCEILTYE